MFVYVVIWYNMKSKFLEILKENNSMIDMGKISVIIPVHNTEVFLNQCIASVLNQTYKNIEVILINDNSNHECKKILEKFAKDHDNIQLFQFDEQKGVGAARNYGVHKATGKYIYFVDSDDYLPERTLEILMDNIKDFDMIRGSIKTTHFDRGMAVILPGLFNTKMYNENKYNLLKSKSVLNFLIKKEFIEKHRLSFSENHTFYSDLFFMVPALINVHQIPYIKEAVYFRRLRNDPIRNPSLSQMDKSLKVGEFLDIYKQLKRNNSDDLAGAYLDKEFLNYYRKTIVSYLKEQENIDSIFDSLHEATTLLNKGVINNYDYVLKKEINTLYNGNKGSYKRVDKRHRFLRELKQGLRSKTKFKLFIYKCFFTKLPIKEDLVLLESFQGRSYSDSTKYIYEYMLEHYPNKKYVWSMNEKREIPGNPKQVKRLSLSYYYYLAKSKYWISNSRMPNHVIKRKENIYLQTWHGTPLKRLAGDMEEVHMPGTNSVKYKRNFFNETQKWDYLVSPNAYSSEIFKRAFWFDKKMIESGYPRNDILYTKNDEEHITKIKKELGIPVEKKVILYAPTWRDDEYYEKGKYKFSLKLDLDKMRDKFGDEYVIILRMHYFVASQMDVSHLEGFAYDLSSYSDIGELYLISDILITDYSSVFFDYAHLKRPILFFTYDIDKYRDSLRGFYFDMEKEVPGPLLTTSDEVLQSIKNINEISLDYKEKYEGFYEKFCSWDDGNASKKVIDEVF